jgi:hypothetical protein
VSEPLEPIEAGRGAQRRKSHHERRLQREALRWWRKPGVLVFLGVLVLAAAGWSHVIRAARRLPVREATVDGLNVTFADATWVVDQMEHGDNFQKPAAMMPDLPSAGQQRMSIYLTFRNRSAETREYHGEEFSLVPEIGDEVAPFGAVVGEARLAPGETLNTAIHFDFDTTRPHGKLLMSWRRGRRSVYFAVPDPPLHYHLRPRGGDVALPPEARLILPIANPDRGQQLYATVYGCSACHGDPNVPESNNIGPHLGSIATVAAGRIPGTSAPQYIYESILEPDSFIAPDCKGGLPCQKPSAMPEYSTLVNLQDAADLLGYMLQLRGLADASATRKGP